MAARRGAERKDREENEVEFSRIVAFSDGIFAIAITLLVLQIDIPTGVGSDGELWHDIYHQHGDLFAFAISFAVIGRFWVVHHGFFGDVGGFDGRLMWLNLLYLFWVVAVPFTSQVLGEYGELSAATVTYAVNLFLLTVTGAAMTSYALRAGLARPGHEHDLELNRNAGLWAAAVLALSVPVAFVVPRAAPFVWLLLFLEPHRRLARFFDDRSG